MHDFGLLNGLHRCRRQATAFVTSGVLAASHRLGPQGAMTVGRTAGRLAGLAWPMRKRLATNLRLAGVTPTSDRIDRYFRRFGCWVGWTLAVYHHGFEGSQIGERVPFDDTLRYFDEAMALGRGVVLVSPHFFCHEIGAAAMNRRHPLTAIVRESKDPSRDAVKEQWYRATGLETLRRPRQSSLMSDTLAYVRALRGGRVLAITPDIMVPANKGVAVEFFGRQVYLSPGMAMLAMRSRAPVLAVWPKWREDSSRRQNDQIMAHFDHPIEIPTTGDRERIARDILQEWCRRCQAHLEQRPEDWMFWLDKRWTKALRKGAA
jgi:lauroyl/myristoyl acyltransferase